MVYGVPRGPPVDEAELTSFVQTLSALPVEEWRKRIDTLKELVDSIPDYSTTPLDENGERYSNDGGGGAAPMTPSSSSPSQQLRNNGNKNQIIIPWYRSSKSLRRLALPLKNLLLDARSAVVKEATELIATLFMVKLQSHPSLTMIDEGGDAKDGEAKNNDGGLETISGGAKKIQQPPPPAFVGRLLFKDLLPAILDLSKQTVKLIRSYGVNMTIDILPHCRVKSCLVVLLERMKTHQNRTVREDCARYSRCVLETWPLDPTGNNENITSNDDIGIVNSRKEERLSLDSARQIGLGLGRTLSDSAKPVREEAKRGFQVLFRRFRPVWDEVMSSGVVRDIRLRKKLYEAGSHADGKLFDDMASLGEMSLNSAVSGLSYASYRSNVSQSHRSYASRGTASNGVPAMIGTPKVSPRIRSRARCSPSSPSYMRGTGSSATRNAEQAKVQAKEASDKYSTNEYVTFTGDVLTTPSPRGKNKKPSTWGEGGGAATTAQQPFASVLQTPNRSMSHHSPVSMQISCNDLKRRLSRRISGIKDEIPEHCVRSPSALTSINETEDSNGVNLPATKDTQSTEITYVALEVIAAHLSHIEQIETLISQEKDLLLDLNKQLGISITDGTKTGELSDRLTSLSEGQVCDYFESVHVCVDKQRNVGEDMLKEMELISQGDGVDVSGIENTPESMQRRDPAQSPLGDPDVVLQRNLF